MSYLQLLLIEKEKEWQRAYENYHKYVMSVVDNDIQCDFLHDAIPDHILEHYHRAFDDYTRVEIMVRANHGSK